MEFKDCHIEQIHSGSGDNNQPKKPSNNSVVIWIGIIGSLASVLGVWLFGWDKWAWWFFGL